VRSVETMTDWYRVRARPARSDLLGGMTENRPRSPAQVNFGAIGGMVWLIVWMFPLLTPANAVVQGQVSPVWPAAVGLITFALLYLVLMIIGFGQAGTLGQRAVGLVMITAIGVALTAGYARQTGSWLTVMMFVAVAAAAALPSKPGGVAVALIATLTLVIGLARHVPASDYSTAIFSTVLAGALVLAVRRMVVLIDELRGARRALADAAVAEERLRFARDLHDLLGHTLSVIVVKAEVARRVADRDPAAAITQASEIEKIGRQALVEIREAVTGYRAGDLTQELDRA
jgi:two-component system, NarL family, sensor histidine kinase DesK